MRRPRPFRRSSFVFVTLLSAFPVLAQPPVAVDPTLTDPARLRYQFVPDAVDTYRLEIEQRMVISGGAVGEPAETLMRMTLDTEHRVMGVEDDGTGEMQQAITSSSVTLSINGQERPAEDLVSLLSGLSMRFRMNDRGEVLNSQIGDLPDPQMAEVVTLLEDSMRHVTVEFPEEEVSIGDTWVKEVPVVVDQPGMALDTSVTATYTFLGYAQLGETRCVVLRTDVQVGLAGTFEEVGISTRADGSGTGTGYTYFDNGSGKLVQGTMDLALGTRITAAEMELQQDISMTMAVSRL